ncbi:argininosuccinate synthase, partial [Candidatus Hakubella thermalkaliphila]
ADVGQPGDLEVIRKRALANGAKEALLVDLKEEFVEGYIAAALRANALYQGKYPVSTALARPLIAQALVAHAHEYGARAVAHGCTAKGNDQVRFDVSVALLEPNLDIIAPAREWKMSREEEIEYARRHGLDIPVTKSSPYSVDENLWGRSIECGLLEDPWYAPGEDVYDEYSA